MKVYKKRLRLLIYPKFQLTLLFGNFLLMLTVLGSVYFSVHRSFENLASNGVKAGLTSDHPYFQLLTYQFEHIAKNLIGAFLIGGALSTVWMLILSNKLAGPILRLKGYFQNLTLYNYKTVEFRKGDFFTELPPLINSAFDRVINKTKE